MTGSVSLSVLLVYFNIVVVFNTQREREMYMDDGTVKKIRKMTLWGKFDSVGNKKTTTFIEIIFSI